MKKNQFDGVEFETVEQIEEGKYNGTIQDIERDTSNYDYTRYKIKLDNKDYVMSVSFPTRITFTDDETPSSQHAKFLYKMNVKSVAEIEKLKGKKVTFLIQQVTKANGTFSEIVKDSLKAI